MSTNFLIVGDIHVKHDNFEEIEIFVNDLINIFKQKKYDYIVLLGDILHWHEKIQTQSLNRALKIIKKCCSLAYTYILVGNHDYTDNRQHLTDNHWMNALKEWKNVQIVDRVHELVLSGGKVLFCPYVYPGRFIEALETCTLDWKSAKLIFAHQEFKSCKMGAIDSKDGDVWENDWPQVISGHIHDCQNVGKKVYYPGAPLQHAFGDTDKRVICSVELDIKDSLKIEEHCLNVPKKHVIRTEIKNLDSSKIENIDGKKKVKLEATAEEFKMFKETKEYKKMKDKGIIFQLQKSKDKINKNGDDNSREEHNGTGNFHKILEDLIEPESDLLKDLYNEIVLERLVL